MGFRVGERVRAVTDDSANNMTGYVRRIGVDDRLWVQLDGYVDDWWFYPRELERLP